MRAVVRPALVPLGLIWWHWNFLRKGPVSLMEHKENFCFVFLFLCFDLLCSSVEGRTQSVCGRQRTAFQSGFSLQRELNSGNQAAIASTFTYGAILPAFSFKVESHVALAALKLAEDDLKLLIPLPLPAECWIAGVHHHVCAYTVLGSEPRTSCTLDKNSVKWATPPAAGSLV